MYSFAEKDGTKCIQSQIEQISLMLVKINGMTLLSIANDEYICNLEIGSGFVYAECTPY